MRVQIVPLLILFLVSSGSWFQIRSGHSGRPGVVKKIHRFRPNRGIARRDAAQRWRRRLRIVSRRRRRKRVQSPTRKHLLEPKRPVQLGPAKKKPVSPRFRHRRPANRPGFAQPDLPKQTQQHTSQFRRRFAKFHGFPKSFLGRRLLRTKQRPRLSTRTVQQRRRRRRRLQRRLRQQLSLAAKQFRAESIRKQKLSELKLESFSKLQAEPEL